MHLCIPSDKLLIYILTIYSEKYTMVFISYILLEQLHIVRFVGG